MAQQAIPVPSASACGVRGLVQAGAVDTGQVHGGRQTWGCRHAHAPHHMARLLPPRLREEGPLSKTVYLPTCHVFAKTTISKDVPVSSVGPGRGWGAAFRVGCALPPSVLLGVLQRPAPGRLRFPSL